MKRRLHSAGALLAVIASLAGCGAPDDPPASAARPADPSTSTRTARWGPPDGRAPLVILISLDTLRADHLGAYGYARFTSPVLDAFAAEGALFEDASTTAPWTLPAHASMLTGLYPVGHRVLTSRTRLPMDVPTVAGYLRADGFSTAAVVNSGWLRREDHMVTRDFEKYLWVEEDAHRTAPSSWVTDQAIDWLEQRRPDEPMFLFVHYYDTHADYSSLPAYEKLFVGDYAGNARGTAIELMQANVDPVYVAYCRANYNAEECNGRHVHEGLVIDEDFERLTFDEADVDHLRSLYDAGIRQLDTELGRLLSFIEKAELADEALVIIVSDHGEEFAEHGGTDHMRTQYQEVVRIPLLVRGPGVPKGARYDVPVSLVDLMPTILSYAGVDAKTPVDGLDLSALWKGTDASAFEGRLIHQESGSGGTATNNITAIRHLAPKVHAVRQGAFKLYYDSRAEKPFVLFDLANDPRETRDVSANHPDLAARLQRAIEERLATIETQEPGPAVEFDPEDEARLRALGYLQ